jgi:hypothetical protein
MDKLKKNYLGQKLKKFIEINSIRSQSILSI